LKHRKRTKELGRHNAWEIASLYERVLMRAWSEMATIDPEQALRWLLVRHAFRDYYSGGRDEFRAAIGSKPDRVVAAADHFLTICRAGKNIWLDFYHLQEATLHILSPDQMLRLLMDHVQKEPVGSDKRAFFYEVAFHFTWRDGATSGPSMFAQLYALGDTDATLQPVRDQAVTAKLPDRYFERKRGRDSDK
jgi:hypothetical protein